MTTLTSPTAAAVLAEAARLRRENRALWGYLAQQNCTCYPRRLGDADPDRHERGCEYRRVHQAVRVEVVR